MGKRRKTVRGEREERGLKRKNKVEREEERGVRGGKRLWR